MSSTIKDALNTNMIRDKFNRNRNHQHLHFIAGIHPLRTNTRFFNNRIKNAANTPLRGAHLLALAEVYNGIYVVE